MAKLISKWFRIAVEGPTVDGRNIKGQDLIEMAQTYNQETYGARINCEHFRSIFPFSDMGSYGDVVALKTQTDNINGEDKIALYAQISPLQNLLDVNSRGQKVYSSIEILPNFAKSGKPYLIGLAITDSPASLGTEAMKFAAQHGNIEISDGLETSIEFVEVPENEPQSDSQGKFKQIIDNIRGMFTKQGHSTDARFTELAGAVQDMGEEFIKQHQAQGSYYRQEVQNLAARLDAQQKAMDEIKAQFTRIDNTDSNPVQRPIATGGDGYQVADC